ncbi:MAG: thioredoxin fold domain-containing protein [Verrucomicrobia subdivision 3 bacterium]|nr:thioredoxin fold domain-containing protein [Limisphaerales bacterium]
MNFSLTILLLLITPAPAKVADTGLALPDLRGREITPLRAPGKKNKQPAVLVFTTPDCPVANKMVPEIRRIAKDFNGRAQFTLVYVDPESTPKTLEQHQTDFALGNIAGVHDRQHRLVRTVGATVTPEVVVVLPDGAIAYRGRINNFYEDFGKPRRVITQHDLRDALTAVLAGRPAPKPRGECIGCFIPKLKRQ